MKDYFGNKLNVKDRVIYFGAVGSKVYPEHGEIIELANDRLYFQPDSISELVRRKKWLGNKAIIVKANSNVPNLGGL